MNLIGYVKGNKATFSERPIGEADSLVFCELSYLNFTHIVDWREPRKTLGELAKTKCEELIYDTLLPKSNKKLLRAIAESPRYRDVTVGYFREHNDEKREIRFAAVCFRTQCGLYVAFRGTDVTLLGWKEDFNMAFRSSIPSQGMAAEYLEEIAEKEEGPLVVGGHSKGGNLALYSAINAEKAVRDRLTAVYNHDGPGFRESVFEREEFKEIEKRVHKTVPHDSLIGILLFHTENYKVVVSRSVLIGQHNPFAWAIKGDKFEELSATTKNSKYMDVALRDWIAALDDSTRRKFVNALFAVIEGSGAKKVPEFLHGTLKKLHGMKKAYQTLPGDEKELIRTNGKLLLKTWLRAIRKGGK